jgi:nucleoside-diphosphate-sugar epimerase
MLSQADGSTLRQRVYNVAGFAPSASEIAGLLADYFPTIEVSYEVHPARQAIVDTWPEDIDDSAARRDFGWAPRYTFEGGFAEYLLPAVCKRYNVSTPSIPVLRLAAN